MEGVNAAKEFGPEERAEASKRLDELIEEFGEDEVELLYDSFEIHLYGEVGYTSGPPLTDAELAEMDQADRRMDAICSEYLRRKAAGTLPWFPAEWAASEA